MKNHSPLEWIVKNFPVTLAQVHAALAYYYDHQMEIEEAIRQGEELAREYAIPSEEHLAQLRERQQKKQQKPD